MGGGFSALISPLRSPGIDFDVTLGLVAKGDPGLGKEQTTDIYVGILQTGEG